MLVRRLARERGTGITVAIKEAVIEALNRRRENRSLWDATADLRAMLLEHERTGLKADKAFYDELSGQGEEDVEGGGDVR